MCFLRLLKNFNFNLIIVKRFYSSTIESILTFSIIVHYSSLTTSLSSKKSLTTNNNLSKKQLINGSLKGTENYWFRTLCPLINLQVSSSEQIVMDSTHPAHFFFQPLPSGQRYNVVYAKTERMKNTSFVEQPLNWMEL